MSNHTPGPWRVDSADRFEVLTADNRFRIQLTTSGADATHAEWEANARLIAAAPELFETLQSVLAVLHLRRARFKGPEADKVDKARALLARIEGTK